MRRSRDFLWLVGLVILIALAASHFYTPGPGPTASPTPYIEPKMLSLELSPFKDFHEAYKLEIFVQPINGSWTADFESLKGFHGNSHLDLKKGDIEALRQGLVKAGIKDLRDADGGEPENQVLYTRLAVQWEGFSSRTVWRGLPPAQGEIAEALMEGPWGDNLRQGLKAVQTRQAQIVAGQP